MCVCVSDDVLHASERSCSAKSTAWTTYTITLVIVASAQKVCRFGNSVGVEMGCALVKLHWQRSKVCANSMRKGNVKLQCKAMFMGSASGKHVIVLVLKVWLHFMTALNWMLIYLSLTSWFPHSTDDSTWKKIAGYVFE